MKVIVTVQKSRAAVVILDDKDNVIDEEVWIFDPPMMAEERKVVAKELFDDAYDTLNFQVHGFPES